MIATAFSLLAAVTHWLTLAQAGRPVDSGLLGLNVARWLIWSLLALAIVWAALRFPLTQHRRRRGLLLVTMSLVVSFAGAMLFHSIFSYPEPLYPLTRMVTYDPWRRAIGDAFTVNVILSVVLLLVLQTYRFYADYRAAELRAAELQEMLARARLDLLRKQLDPHLLFNALNSVGALLRSDAAAAGEMLNRLTALLRNLLQSANQQEVELRRELELVSNYLAIQRVRFADRLTVWYQVDPDALDCLVPTLLLQPLVENSVRHGMIRTSEPLHLSIAARRENRHLSLEIRDDGRGAVVGNLREGLGLSTVRERIRRLYGAAASVTINAHPMNGFTISIQLPAP